IVPGTTDPVDTVEDAARIVDEAIGYPVAIKAAGGGGGKGFRVAMSADELEKPFEGAAGEGGELFADPTVSIERELPAPRQVEVEHWVTEMTTGMDIVREQIRIAAGEELSIAQDDVRLGGHAIECRVNAEDAAKNFAPAPGTITAYREPSGAGVRVDSGVEAGFEITPLYDPMIATLIVRDGD